jgi:hypothetical protein
MFLLNGQPLQIDTPFEVDGTHYPSNWLRLTSLEEKQAIGITEVADQEPYDDRFYWGVDNPKQLDDLVVTPEDGEPYTQRGLKYQWCQQVKATAHSLLAPTDWVVMRQLLKGIGMSAIIENYRDAVVAESNRLETAINACADVPALIAVISAQNWPQQ